MALTEKQLTDLKEEIDEAKEKASSLAGQITAITNQLKSDFGCATLEAAKVKLKEIEKKKDSLNLKIEKASNELEELLNSEEE